MWKSAWRFPEKIKIGLPYNPAISPVGFYSKKIKTAIAKDICTFMFTAVIIYDSQDMEAKYMSISRWMGKADVRVKVTRSCLTLCDPTEESMEFSRPEYWSGYPFPSPGDLPNPGIEPGSPALQEDSLPAELPRKPKKVWCIYNTKYYSTTHTKMKPCPVQQHGCIQGVLRWII